MIAIPAWIDNNDRQYRPTEMFVPVRAGIGPVWDYQRETGGWFACLEVNLPPIADIADPRFMECDHVHPTEFEAWACAQSLERTLVEAVTTR